MFTSPLELNAFLRRFQDGALRPLAAPILGCTRLRSNPGKYPNVVIQLLFNKDIKIENEGVQHCSDSRKPSRNQLHSATALHRLTRDEEASRAGRYLEGTCALAIRPCNR